MRTRAALLACALVLPRVTSIAVGVGRSDAIQPAIQPVHYAVLDPSLGKTMSPNCGDPTRIGDNELVPGSDSAFAGTGVFQVTDGKNNTRCFSLISSLKPLPTDSGTRRVPTSSLQETTHVHPMPVVVWFHGVVDDANLLTGLDGKTESGCAFRKDRLHDKSLADLALDEQSDEPFAVICPEASRFVYPDSNKSNPDILYTIWEIPPNMSSATGTPCDDTDSRELQLLQNMFDSLDPSRFDLTRVYFAGESAGGAMALYAATCARQRGLFPVLAVSVNSAGLKVKGDGTRWPLVPSDKTEIAECEECGFYPIVPNYSEALVGLKLCLYDGTLDQLSFDQNYTLTTLNLARLWPLTGGTLELHMVEGRGHVYTGEWDAVIRCLRNIPQRGWRIS